MAKIRGVKPDFWTDEKVVSLKMTTRLFFIGLWNFADDYGVFEWKPLELKMKIFPADNFDIKSSLRELVENTCVYKFIHVNKKEYGFIINFSKHQKPDKRFMTSLFPDVETFLNSLDVDTTCLPCVHIDDSEGEGEGEGDIEKEKIHKKEKFGEFKNVFLKKDEYRKLIEKFGESLTKEKIETLSMYLESKGKKYKSHYATILNWANRDGITGNKKEDYKTKYNKI